MTIPVLSAEAESLIARFETAWLDGNRPDLMRALDGCPIAERSAILWELVHADLEFRIGAGDEVSVKDYLVRFPELSQDASAVCEFVEAEVQFRKGTEQPLAPAEITSRFPNRFLSVEETDYFQVKQIVSQVQVREIGASLNALLHPSECPNELGRLGGYRILGLLGAGGMGFVLRSVDVRLNRSVALKVMRPEWASDPVARVRFLREAESQAALEHDNIVPIYQIGEDGGVPFIVMPLLEGESLESRFRSGRPLTLLNAVQIAWQLAQGLAIAHSAGLIHRDVKPSNIWLETDSAGEFQRVRLLDFGLALRDYEETELTGTGVAVGTPAYMAPEQARGNAEPRSDLFSLGCVMFQMVTSHRPFSGKNVVAIVAAISTEIPPSARGVNSAIPTELSNLIDRLLAKELAKRPISATEVATELSRIASVLEPQEFMEETQARMNATTEIKKTILADSTFSPKLRLLPMPMSRFKKNRKRWAFISLVALSAVLLGVLIGSSGTIIRIATNKGELVIETDDPNLEVIVKNESAIVYDRVKERRFVLTAGDYEVEVREDGEDGLRFDTKRFTIVRGGKETFNVVMKPNAKMTSPKDPDMSKAATIVAKGDERKAAKWVLSIGGKITIFSTGQLLSVASAKDLPAADWQLIEINLGGIVNNEGGNLHVTDAGLEHLQALPNLTALGLNGTQVNDAGLEHLRSLPNLRALGLNDTLVTDAGLAHLKNLTKLRDLRLTGNRWFTGIGLKYLQGLADITELHLSGSRFDDLGLEQIKTMSNLRVLSIGSTGVTDVGLSNIKNLTNLTYLNLERTRVGDAGLAQLQKLSNLKILLLNKNQTLTGSGLMHLKLLINLEELHLINTRVEDASLEHLKTLIQLKVLHLSGTRVTDEGLERLKPLTNLAELHLWDLQVGNSGMVHLQALTNLRFLQLGRTQVNDAGLIHIKQLINLTSLHLQETQMSDKGLSHLNKMVNLRKLEIQNTKVTEAGVRQLADNLPNCEIRWNGGTFPAVNQR